jgi:hypothetical protein
MSDPCDQYDYGILIHKNTAAKSPQSGENLYYSVMCLDRLFGGAVQDGRRTKAGEQVPKKGYTKDWR